MILSYFGRKTTVAECTQNCGIGGDGLTAKALAKTARSFGLRVQAFSVGPSQFEHLRLPAIAHWEFNHFVVVEHWSPHQVKIVDPACGRQRLDSTEFETGLTGVVLTLEPGT